MVALYQLSEQACRETKRKLVYWIVNWVLVMWTVCMIVSNFPTYENYVQGLNCQQIQRLLFKCNSFDTWFSFSNHQQMCTFLVLSRVYLHIGMKKVNTFWRFRTNNHAGFLLVIPCFFWVEIEDIVASLTYSFELWKYHAIIKVMA